jgi:periodic tryptophan protein 1
MASMITTAAWVPRGFAAPFPTKYTFDEAEFERIAELAKLQLDDAKEDLKEAQEEHDGGVKLSEDGAEAKTNGKTSSEEKDPDA